VDVLLLTEQPTFCGCVVPSRLIGVIEAQQTEKDGESERNDRLVAIPVKARNYADIKSVNDLDKHLLEEIEQKADAAFLIVELERAGTGARERPNEDTRVAAGDGGVVIGRATGGTGA